MATDRHNPGVFDVIEVHQGRAARRRAEIAAAQHIGMLLKPCTACACSGIYVDFGGPDVGGISVACAECGGTGWVEAA